MSFFGGGSREERQRLTPSSSSTGRSSLLSPTGSRAVRYGASGDDDGAGAGGADTRNVSSILDDARRKAAAGEDEAAAPVYASSGGRRGLCPSRKDAAPWSRRGRLLAITGVALAVLVAVAVPAVVYLGAPLIAERAFKSVTLGFVGMNLTQPGTAGFTLSARMTLSGLALSGTLAGA